MTGAEEAETDFVGTLTNLFKDVAVAVDENEQFVAGTFGPETAVEAILGLQQVLAPAWHLTNPYLSSAENAWRLLVP